MTVTIKDKAPRALWSWSQIYNKNGIYRGYRDNVVVFVLINNGITMISHVGNEKSLHLQQSHERQFATDWLFEQAEAQINITIL